MPPFQPAPAGYPDFFFLRRLATPVLALGLLLACTSAIVAAKQYENTRPPVLDCGSSIESGVPPGGGGGGGGAPPPGE